MSIRVALVRWIVVAALILIASRTPARAQDRQPAQSSSEHQHPAAAMELFPTREVSGTAWVADETPMYGIERAWRGWHLMLHGNAFAQFLYEPGDRHRTGGFSTRQFGSVNWGMMMARRSVGAGRVGLRAMISVEPWTVGDCGFLNFLATGEMCEGDTIHDRQHPHDVFMELAAEYDRPLRGSLRWQVYGGLSGEPALGPPGFPHRLSALPNPIAPIAHHWLDATHISFGLVTGAVYDREWKAEVSLFNGREPDENRADLDLAPLDSFSGRFTYLPSKRIALQVSAGHLHEAESQVAPQPRSSVKRATASATYHHAANGERLWATTLAYGLNAGREIVVSDALDAVTHAAMLETTVTMRDRHTWFGRAEIVGKPAHDLHAHEYPLSTFTVGKVQVGYVHHLKAWNGLVPGIGGMVSATLVPPQLESRYGGRVSPGFGVFLNLRAIRHGM